MDQSAAEQQQQDKLTRHESKAKQDALDSHLAKLGGGRSVPDDSGRKKTRAEKRQAKVKRAQTAGPGWYGMPAFPGADSKSGSVGASTLAASRYATNPRGRTAEEMRREVQAIRLRNALDPKRFYKGGGKVEKGMPKYAQLGRIVGSEIEPGSILPKYSAGTSALEEVVKDSEAAAYAKRKFNEQQERNASGGRGYFKAKSKKPRHRR
ncbi:Uncharacterized conserved protein [Ceraceosorus bombacis]|uniref:Uncharacterized conserved protein n=1 Tax=Ceraceosorus bombacis TaxID=401625 RepID=A0A0P1BIL7_9BASI|nr:Uncharacterized conserved protein [Ceraceosorus bombacis]